jgi:anaerobic carbon-monoxide dehydrogenase iron sulfur subunit
MKRALNVAAERCLGCHSCEFACAVAHSREPEPNAIVRSGARPGYRIFVEAHQGRAIPVHCLQCEEASCLASCPTGAIQRREENGPVLLDPTRCVGCRICVVACPRGVMTLTPDGSGALKCDLCAARLATGLEPACVAACPTKAVVLTTEA